MSDATLGFLILGIGMLVMLGIVFAISARAGRRTERPTPPAGVHLPNPSYLPVLFSLGAALLGAGFAFRGDWGLANPFLAIPGVLVIIGTAVGWVRAANHEWIEVEHGGPHDDGVAH